MENNPYDTSLEWASYHSQPTEDARGAVYPYPLTPSYQQEKIRPRPAVSPLKRLSKSEALDLVSSLKGYIVVASLLGFATMGGLIANQIFTTNSSINQPQTQPQANPGMQPSFRHHRFGHDADPANPSGGFFNQQGSDQGQGPGQGGYGFGQGNNSAPFSGSHTS